MLQGEIFAEQNSQHVAAVFEPMDLCEHDQPLRINGLETRFDKTKVIEASKSGGDMRRRACVKTLISTIPIDQTFRADRVNRSENCEPDWVLPSARRPASPG